MLLTACQPAGEKQAAAQEQDPHAGLELPPGHPQVDLPGAAATSGEAAGPNHPPVIALDGEGLRLVDPKSGATRPLAFGVEEAQLKTVAEKLKGPAQSGRNAECGAGALNYLSWPDGLTLYSLDGLFAGWALDAPDVAKPATGSKKPLRLTTISGVGIGSSRTELLAAYDAKIEQTTLGTEFNAAGLSGILDSTGPKAKVTNLWSGVNCVFR